MDLPHPSDHDLEQYYLGQIIEETKLAALEEHLLACPDCVERAKAIQDYVDAIRRGIIGGNYDQDRDPES